MSSCREHVCWRRGALALALLLACATATAQADRFAGIGRTATSAELKAWDIDVRPDFKGLPTGSGSVRRGEQVWEAQCASCHGSFGESNDVFAPLIGGTTAVDVAKGRVAGLMPGANTPVRTTVMKAAYVSTLWDYIRRAMPWTAPKSLSVDDVYAVTAYMLSLANVMPDDATLSDRNIAEVQKRMPNRDGLNTRHAMWPGSELGGVAKPDVQGSACMRDCAVPTAVTSLIPDYARNAHGNLAEQTRTVGSTRGTVTAVAGAPASNASQGNTQATAAADLMPVLQKNVCVACHAMDGKLVGPSFREIAGRYRERADAASYLAGRIRAGGQGVWGNVPMPAQTLPAEDAQRIAQWLARGAAP
jgi:cytochrome c